MLAAALTTLAITAPVRAEDAPVFRRAAEETFILHGAGWGHGIGMSQYGAYGLALEGWSAERIVRYYYTGVEVERRDPPARLVRVGLLQSRSRVTVIVEGGSPRVRAAGETIETLAEGDVRGVTMKDGRYRLETGEGAAVGEPISGRLQVRGGVIRIEEWGHVLGRGRLELPAAGGNAFHVVAALDPEQYLFGLGEVPSSWPQAALRAQAIAARTYAFRRIEDGGRTGCGCAIYADTRDQAYVGWEKETGTDGDRWVDAVRASEGLVATYEGALIATLYSSSSGGFTENVENVWGGEAYPYLKGKCDPGDFVAANPNRTWTVTIEADELAARLRTAFGWDLGEVRELDVGRRGVSGRPVRISVRGTSSAGGGFSRAVSGWDLRSALGLKDTRFSVGTDQNVTGAIRAAYDDLRCRPGLASGPQRTAAGGRWQAFQHGRMYARGDAAVWLDGPVLAAYLGAGGPEGPLGYPLSPVTEAEDGSTEAAFEGGVVRCDPGGDCTVAAS